MKFLVENEIVGDTSEPNRSKVFRYVTAKCECGRELSYDDDVYEDAFGDNVCLDCLIKGALLGTVQEVFESLKGDT